MRILDHWPETNKRKRESNYSHLAGEYFVAAELSKRGYSVALTLGNAKAIDLFAEKGLCTVNVQVKALSLRKHVGWPMLKAKVFDRIIYVMVCLNDNDTPPTYFLARGDEIRDKISEYDSKGGYRGILNFGKINSAQFKSRWDKIADALQNTV
ncbi:MAG TPA: hypothetical protein VNX28_00520 [Gemmataceae bacterium]|jgi:hypothetical protein|nr:hypothetical protein [Gemmataceae bacterium]